MPLVKALIARTHRTKSSLSFVPYLLSPQIARALSLKQDALKGVVQPNSASPQILLAETLWSSIPLRGFLKITNLIARAYLVQKWASEEVTIAVPWKR